MNRSILIRQKKGGVGKSAIAVALENCLTKAGVQMRLIDADTPEDDDTGASLSAMFGQRAERFRINPAAADVEEDPNALRTHWFPLCQAIMDGGALVDFGANTNGPFDAALRDGGWGQDFADAGTPISVLIPVTTDKVAVEGGIQCVGATREILPTAKIVVALVGKENTPWKQFMATPQFAPLLQERNRGVDFIEVPRCVSLLWNPCAVHGIDFVTAIQAATDDPENFGKRLGLSKQEVRLGIAKLKGWFDTVCAEFQAVGLVPAAKAEVPAKAKAKAD